MILDLQFYDINDINDSILASNLETSARYGHM